MEETMAKILVIDDNRLHRAMITSILKEEGHAIVEAEDGREALTKVASENPDLIVLDWLMPGVDGAEICRRLKADAFLQHIPVLMLTVLDSRFDKVKALEIGADGYLAKPFHPEELTVQVETLLRRCFDRNPLTKLPAAPLIQKRIEEHIRAGDEFSICYADIDDFKAYNDKYGYPRGDEVILFLARIIRETIEEQGGEFFIGHIGGDDFIIITAPQEVDALCRGIIERFDAGIADYYSPEDRERGYIEAKDRRGVIQRWPIMTLSVAVATNERKRFLSYAQVGEILADLKAHAKGQPGSTYVKDRRAD